MLVMRKWAVSSILSYADLSGIVPSWFRAMKSAVICLASGQSLALVS